jgi:GT2 family glycosyltransferase
VPSPEVVVAVVCWNCRADIERCLSQLRANTDHDRWRAVVIDNASSDGTAEWLASVAPRWFDLVGADQNLGWVGALNLVLERFQADHYFFLNPDAFVEPGWLKPLVQALERDGSAGFASPRFLYPNGSIHYAGAFVARTGGIRVLGHGSPNGPPYDSPREVPFAHGQCLVRGAMVREVGLFDPGFGIGYYEEIDYQLRARRLGWKALYVPDSVVVHSTSQAFNQRPSGFKEELMIRNWLRVLTLHWPLETLAWRLPLELMRPLRIVRDKGDPRPILRAWHSWLKTVPDIRRKRAAIRGSGRPVDFATLAEPRS